MKSGLKSGRGDWIRTNDHLLPKQIRYQAALHPEQLVRHIFNASWTICPLIL